MDSLISKMEFGCFVSDAELLMIDDIEADEEMISRIYNNIKNAKYTDKDECEMEVTLDDNKNFIVRMI